jgi:sugar phosphate isomerase/epimerase
MFPFHHFLVPGEPGDEFDFESLVGALARAGYDGFISVETFSWMREDKAAVAHAMMRPVLERLVGEGSPG